MCRGHRRPIAVTNTQSNANIPKHWAYNTMSASTACQKLAAKIMLALMGFSFFPTDRIGHAQIEVTRKYCVANG